MSLMGGRASADRYCCALDRDMPAAGDPSDQCETGTMKVMTWSNLATSLITGEPLRLAPQLPLDTDAGK